MLWTKQVKKIIFYDFLFELRLLNYSCHFIGIDIRHPKKKNCWPRKLDSHWHKFQIGSKIDDNAIELAYHSPDLISTFFKAIFYFVRFYIFQRKMSNYFNGFSKEKYGHSDKCLLPVQWYDKKKKKKKKNQPKICNFVTDVKLFFSTYKCAKWNTCFDHLFNTQLNI